MLFDAGGVDVRVDLLDTECYFFDRVALEGALVENPELESLADELVPWLVRSQFVKPATPGGHKRVDSMDFGDPSGKGHPNAREGRGAASSVRTRVLVSGAASSARWWVHTVPWVTTSRSSTLSSWRAPSSAMAATFRTASSVRMLSSRRSRR